MRRLTQSMVLLALAGIVGSCGPKKESELVIDVTPDTVNLIDGTWYKCGSTPSDEDLSGMYFTASRVNFAWTNKENKLVIQQLKIELDSPDIDGEGRFSLSGDELVAMFSAFESPIGSGAIVIDPNLVGTQTTACGLRVGGIKLKDDTKTAYITATVRLKGIEIDGQGDSVSNVTGEQTIVIQYEP